jgi:condensin complex subunit 3
LPDSGLLVRRCGGRRWCPVYTTFGVLDILFSRFHKDDWEFDLEGDNHDNVQTILGEGFAKILLLSGNFASIPADLHIV